MGKFSTVKEVFEFLNRRKKWWLYPIILFLLLLGGLIIFASNSAIAPILYPIF